MIDPRIERMLQETARRYALPEWAARDLRASIESSPYLASVMRKAIEQGDLKEIHLADVPGQSGHYNADTKSISLSSRLFLWDSPNERVDMLTGVLGHETGHALMARSTLLSVESYGHLVESAIRSGSASGASTVDVTAHAKSYVNAFRQNEAFAELLSINAVSSRVRNEQPDAGDREVLRRLDFTSRCVTHGRPAPGIERGEDGMLHTGGKIDSPAVNAVAACHFDLSAGRLGEAGRADYNTYYLASAASNAAAIADDVARTSRLPLPRVGLNMAELGSSFGDIQAAGLRLGGRGETFVFSDTSHGQARAVEVMQVGRPGTAQPAVQPQAAPSQAQMLADNPAHPDHSTYARIHDWVQGTGNWSAEEARNVSASLYRQQVGDPLIKRVDQVTGALGGDGAQNVFAVHAPFGGAGPHFHARVDGRLAAQEPAQLSLEQAEGIRQAQSLQQTQERTQQQTEMQTHAQSMRGL